MNATLHENFAEVAERWNALHQLTPYQTYEWSSLYWEHLRGSKALQVLSIPSAIIPLQRREVAGLVVLEMVASRGTDYLDGVGEAAGVHRLVESIMQLPWDVLRLEDIPENGVIAGFAKDPRARSQINVDCYEIKLPAHLSARTGADLRRFDRRLLRDRIAQRYVWSDSVDTLDEHLAVHMARQRAKAGSGYFGASTLAFVSTFFREMARSGRLLLAGLYLDETLAASVIGVEWGRTVFACYTGMATAWERFAPGWLLWAFLITEAERRGFESIDLGRGGESYKSRLGGMRKANLLIECFRDRSTIGTYERAYRAAFEGVGFDPTPS